MKIEVQLSAKVHYFAAMRTEGTTEIKAKSRIILNFYVDI